jgi:hyperosmotically inducible periplasmic protein
MSERSRRNRELERPTTRSLQVNPAGGHMKSWSLISLCGAALLATACAQTDAGITTSVKSQLVKDDTVKARQIDVTTRDHVVTLTGEVNTQEEEARALQIARSTRGVSSVVDRIEVGPRAPRAGEAQPPVAGDRTSSESLGDKMSDASLTATVKSKLLADPDTSGLRIDVDTKDKVVTLTGKVKSQAEKGQAVQIARNTEGVKGVNDKLTIGQ